MGKSITDPIASGRPSIEISDEGHRLIGLFPKQDRQQF
jgi:hypothetical protein